MRATIAISLGCWLWAACQPIPAAGASPGPMPVPDDGGRSDGGAVAAEPPDGGPARSPVDFDSSLIYARGAAGEEQLIYGDGTHELTLTGPGPFALCGSPFCGSPPAAAITRFPEYDYLTREDAVYFDALAGEIASVSLVTGARTVLSSGVPWLRTAAGGVDGAVTAFARAGERTYWSLREVNAMGLYVSAGPGLPLRLIDRVMLAPGQDAVSSALQLRGGFLAWGVELSVSQPVFNLLEENRLYDAAGALKFASSTGLPRGATGCAVPAALSATHYAVSYVLPQRTCSEPETLVVDLTTWRSRSLNKPEPTALAMLSSDGTLVFENGLLSTGDVFVAVYSTDSGDRLETFPGRVIAVTEGAPLRAVLKNGPGVSDHLWFHAVGGGGNTELAPHGAIAWGDPPYSDRPGLDVQVWGDAEQGIALAGMLPDGCTNVGLVLLNAGQAPTALEPAACSERFVRHPRVSADHRFVFYLDEQGGQLDIVRVELGTLERVVVVASPRSERGFVLPANPGGE